MFMSAYSKIIPLPVFPHHFLFLIYMKTRRTHYGWCNAHLPNRFPSSLKHQQGNAVSLKCVDMMCIQLYFVLVRRKTELMYVIFCYHVLKRSIHCTVLQFSPSEDWKVNFKNTSPVVLVLSSYGLTRCHIDGATVKRQHSMLRGHDGGRQQVRESFNIPLIFITEQRCTRSCQSRGSEGEGFICK